jgi:hypothetical protein
VLQVAVTKSTFGMILSKIHAKRKIRSNRRLIAAMLLVLVAIL